jgi:hypothetical protein
VAGWSISARGEESQGLTPRWDSVLAREIKSGSRRSRGSVAVHQIVVLRSRVRI